MYLYIGKRTRRNDPSTRRVFPAAIKFELKAHDVRTGLRLEEEKCNNNNKNITYFKKSFSVPFMTSHGASGSFPFMPGAHTHTRTHSHNIIMRTRGRPRYLRSPSRRRRRSSIPFLKIIIMKWKNLINSCLGKAF